MSPSAVRGLRRPPIRNKETRAAILAAAGGIFAKSGLAGARTDTIAAAAGVNKALLYYYFKSKDGLYEAVVEDHFCEFNRRAMEVLNAPGSARAVLLRYVSLHLDFISARHQSAPLFQQLTMSGGKFLERLIRRYFAARGQALGKLIERGVRSGEFRRVDRFHAAISIVSLIVFYFSAARVLQLLGHPDAYSPVNLKRRKREVLDFIRHGLFSDSKFSPP
ncbi:MAG TPA: TetR/AcrR family transcriptional regulator [Tepidisphaeraceae bacterium]|nr:TetR/AcrR family transcriptional regulator [Tepidisphaeraceae bacterium]